MRHALNSLPPSDRRESYRQNAAVRVQQRHKQRHKQRHPYRSTTTELIVKLSINLAIVAAAATALVKLIPYNLSQQTKLQDINAEVETLEDQVDSLRSDFSRYFDPQQAKSVMQEESNRVNLGQLRVVWTEPPESGVELSSH
ncbi:MAG: hypothetical protein ACFE0I_03290 [Elainellaceae cyanobacterium]